MHGKTSLKKTIAIADDDDGMQQIFKMIFEKAGYETAIYTEHKKLLNNDHDLPSLYILDKHLPGFNGLDICSQLKADEKTKHIPVIIISGTPGIAQLAKDAGANDALEKPFTTKELLDMVAKYAV